MLDHINELPLLLQTIYISRKHAKNKVILRSKQAIGVSDLKWLEFVVPWAYAGPHRSMGVSFYHGVRHLKISITQVE